jgi:hypothetical protein
LGVCLDEEYDKDFRFWAGHEVNRLAHFYFEEHDWNFRSMACHVVKNSKRQFGAFLLMVSCYALDNVLAGKYENTRRLPSVLTTIYQLFVEAAGIKVPSHGL